MCGGGGGGAVQNLAGHSLRSASELLISPCLMVAVRQKKPAYTCRSFILTAFLPWKFKIFIPHTHTHTYIYTHTNTVSQDN